MAVTAHELGHVQQYQTGSTLIKARGALLPALQFSPTISRGARAVLLAAALTYLAAAITSILQLLYYISIAERRSD